MITSYQISLDGARWVDASSLFTQDNLPDLLPGSLAINNSLYNIFNCPIGARGKIFEPEYGSALYVYLQEPVDNITASHIEMAMFQAIDKWEPRLRIDKSKTFVQPTPEGTGYRVRIAGIDVVTGDPVLTEFTIDNNP